MGSFVVPFRQSGIHGLPANNAAHQVSPENLLPSRFAVFPSQILALLSFRARMYASAHIAMAAQEIRHAGCASVTPVWSRMHKLPFPFGSAYTPSCTPLPTLALSSSRDTAPGDAHRGF